MWFHVPVLYSQYCILVLKDANRCPGASQWPLSADWYKWSAVQAVRGMYCTYCTQNHSVICYWNIRKYIFVNWFCSEIWTPHLFPNQSRRVPYKQVEMIDRGKSSTKLINLIQYYFCLFVYQYFQNFWWICTKNSLQRSSVVRDYSKK